MQHSYPSFNKLLFNYDIKNIISLEIHKYLQAGKLILNVQVVHCDERLQLQYILFTL